MKNLENVVEDIYETLSCLCDQEDLNIPEKDIEDFGERMKDSELSNNLNRSQSCECCFT